MSQVCSQCLTSIRAKLPIATLMACGCKVHGRRAHQRRQARLSHPVHVSPPAWCARTSISLPRPVRTTGKRPSLSSRTACSVNFFGGIGRADLAMAAQEAAKFPDRDRGLDQLAGQAAHASPADRPSCAVEPAEINLGQIAIGKDRTVRVASGERGQPARSTAPSLPTANGSRWATLRAARKNCSSSGPRRSMPVQLARPAAAGRQQAARRATADRNQWRQHHGQRCGCRCRSRRSRKASLPAA